MRSAERWNVGERVRAHENPAAWVQLVALRLAVRSARRHQRGQRLQPASSPPSHPEPVDIDLVRAIAQLSDRQRTAIVLHHLVDLPVSGDRDGDGRARRNREDVAQPARGAARGSAR